MITHPILQIKSFHLSPLMRMTAGAVDTMPPAGMAHIEFRQLASRNQAEVIGNATLHGAIGAYACSSQALQGTAANATNHHRIHVSAIQRLQGLTLAVQVNPVGIFKTVNVTIIGTDNNKKTG